MTMLAVNETRDLSSLSSWTEECEPDPENPRIVRNPNFHGRQAFTVFALHTDNLARNPDGTINQNYPNIRGQLDTGVLFGPEAVIEEEVAIIVPSAAWTGKLAGWGAVLLQPQFSPPYAGYPPFSIATDGIDWYLELADGHRPWQARLPRDTYVDTKIEFLNAADGWISLWINGQQELDQFEAPLITPASAGHGVWHLDLYCSKVAANPQIGPIGFAGVTNPDGTIAPGPRITRKA